MIPEIQQHLLRASQQHSGVTDAYRLLRTASSNRSPHSLLWQWLMNRSYSFARARSAACRWLTCIKEQMETHPHRFIPFQDREPDDEPYHVETLYVKLNPLINSLAQQPSRDSYRFSEYAELLSCEIEQIDIYNKAQRALEAWSWIQYCESSTSTESSSEDVFDLDAYNELEDAIYARIDIRFISLELARLFGSDFVYQLKSRLNEKVDYQDLLAQSDAMIREFWEGWNTRFDNSAMELEFFFGLSAEEESEHYRIIEGLGLHDPAIDSALNETLPWNLPSNRDHWYF